MIERNILVGLDHPFLIKLHNSFQNDKKLFFVLEYCPGGELFGLLSKKQRLSEEQYSRGYIGLSSIRRKLFWQSSTCTVTT